MNAGYDKQGIERIRATLKEIKVAAGQLVVDTRYNAKEKAAMLNGLKQAVDNLGVMICNMGGDPFEVMAAVRCSQYLIACIADLKMEGDESDEDN